VIDLDIRPYRLKSNRNILIRKIWTFLKLRENLPLTP
jgi:hypothetical protein